MPFSSSNLVFPLLNYASLNISSITYITYSKRCSDPEDFTVTI